MHVDDVLVFSTSKNLLAEFKNKRHSIYNLTWKDKLTLDLGIKITQHCHTQTIHLSQEDYLKTVLDRFDMTNCNLTNTPLPSNSRLVLMKKS